MVTLNLSPPGLGNRKTARCGDSSLRHHQRQRFDISTPGRWRQKSGKRWSQRVLLLGGIAVSNWHERDMLLKRSLKLRLYSFQIGAMLGGG